MSQIANNKQLLRFGLVGAGNTVLDFGLLFLLKSLGLPVITANIISSTTAFVVSFVANRKFTFKSQSNTVVRQMILFTIVTLFGLWVLQTIVIRLTLPVLSSAMPRQATLCLLVAKLFATCVSLVWNYILYATVVFKKKD